MALISIGFIFSNFVLQALFFSFCFEDKKVLFLARVNVVTEYTLSAQSFIYAGLVALSLVHSWAT